MALKTKLKIFSGVFLVFLILGFGYLLNQSKKSNQSAINQSNVESPQFSVVPKSNSILISANSPTLGPADAGVTIVEFLDPECEACRAMHPIVKRIMSENSGKIRLVIRYMPFHQNSRFAANVLEGTREQGKFWEALSLMFENQDVWASHHDPKPELVFQILKPLGLDLEKIRKNAEKGLYNELIEKDFQDGKQLGVNKTPTFFVNGNELMEIGYEPLKMAVEAILDK